MPTSTYKLKDIQSLSSVGPQDKIESGVEGIEGGTVLVLRFKDQVHAMGAKCTHYGAPLKMGIVAPDGRITCPWHGACFNIGSGDLEDAPAPNALNKFEVFEKDGAVWITGDEEAIRTGQRDPVPKCQVTGNEREKVVVVGGGSGTLGFIQALRELDFKDPITIITREPNQIIDRTKLSKALIPDVEKLLIRPKKWYEEAAIETVSDEVTSVDFGGKTVSTKSGKKIPYTRLVLAPGGQPRSLPLPGFNELGNIFLLRFVTDVQAILGAIGNQRRKIAVIGSSFIGMEVGNALAGKNNDVTIIGQEAAPMAKIMGEQVGRVFQKNLEKNGVKFHLNAGVDKAVPSENDPGKVGAVHLKDGTVVPCDLVVLGTGVRPATDFLKNNPSITLENDGSVKVDEYFSVPGVDSVYAIGDIATFPYHGPGSQSFKGIYTRIEHWNVAQNAGRGVARTLTHELSRTLRIKHKSFIPVFWSALGAQLRYCGATPNGYDDVIIQSEDIENTSKFVAFYCKAQTVVAVATMGMDPVMAKCAELMRRKNMLSKKDIQDGKDVLAVEVPDNVPL